MAGGEESVGLVGGEMVRIDQWGRGNVPAIMTSDTKTCRTQMKR